MLILNGNTDLLQLKTSAAGNIDCHASWMDNVSGAVAPGRTNTPTITTSATTIIVPNPASGVQRNIKTLYVRNLATTGSNRVTVMHSDSVTVVELFSTVLAPNQTLQYIDEVGFIVGASNVPAGTNVLIDKKVIVTPTSVVDFTAGIDQTYDQYMFRIYDVKLSVISRLALRVSMDGGATFKNMANGYQYGYLFVGPIDPVYGAVTQANYMQCSPQWPDQSQTARLGNIVIINFAKPWEAGWRRMFLVDTVAVNQGEGLCRTAAVAEYNGGSTVTPDMNPINAIRFLSSDGGNITAGTFNLYGIKP